MATTRQETLTSLSATELATLIARGDISSVEAVEAHIERIERVNPGLNAVVVKRYEAAQAEAREADEHRVRGEALGPLHGVPITIKETLDLVDTPSTFGLPSRARILARQDDLYVARMRKAGAIILGKTNVAQLLYYIESDNPLYGHTNNPWNLERSSGGSSGGQAAIIATGGSPLGLGPILVAVFVCLRPFVELQDSNPLPGAHQTLVATVSLSVSVRLSVRWECWRGRLPMSHLA